MKKTNNIHTPLISIPQIIASTTQSPINLLNSTTYTANIPIPITINNNINQLPQQQSLINANFDPVLRQSLIIPNMPSIVSQSETVFNSDHNSSILPQQLTFNNRDLFLSQSPTILHHPISFTNYDNEKSKKQSSNTNHSMYNCLDEFKNISLF